MTRIVKGEIFLAKSGVWWAPSPVHSDRIYSLHTKDKGLAQRRYDQHCANLTEYEKQNGSLWPIGRNEEGD